MIPIQNNCDMMPVTFAWFGWLLWALAFDSVLSFSPLHLFMSPANECRKVNFPTWRDLLKFYANWLKEPHLQQWGRLLTQAALSVMLVPLMSDEFFVFFLFLFLWYHKGHSPHRSQNGCKRVDKMVNLWFAAYRRLYFLMFFIIIFRRVSFHL